MSFPKKGKFFPGENGYNGKTEQLTNGGFVEEIAAALKRSLGDSRAGVKTVAAWTGANEKTVKNWFSGTYGPSGAHMIALTRHGTIAFAILLFLLALRRSGERAGRLAERLDTREKANEVQRRMLEAAARRPRNRNELVDRPRDGGF